MNTTINFLFILSSLFSMQLETQFGKEFQCTPAFWAKLSTRKLMRELKKFTSTDCSGISLSKDVLCWIIEKMNIDTSDAIKDVVTQPLQDTLQKTNCSCTIF